MAVESGTLSVRTTSKTVDSAPASAPIESDMAPETPAAVQAGKWRENLTTLFSVVHAVLLRSFGYARSEELMLIGGANRQGQQTGVSAPDFRAIQQRAHSFQQVGASRVQAFTLHGVREPVNVYGQLVTSECFGVLGARPLIGRVFAETDFAADARPVALLSFKLWRRDFASDPQVIGRKVLIDGVDYSVIGVMPAEFQYPHPAFLMWAPWRMTAAELANRRAHAYRLIARLRPGVTQAAAASELTSLSTALERESPDTNAGWRATLEPVAEPLIGRLRPALFTMLGAVGFVLLIACLNVANLLMARGLARARELAIRTALGARRGRLATQLLVEGLLIAGSGGIVGVLFAHGFLRLLIALLPLRSVAAFPRIDQASLNGPVLAAAVLMTIASGVLFGLVPAMELGRLDIDAALCEGGRTQTGGRRHRRFLSALIVMESALSVVLLVGAGLMLRSFARIAEVNPGFHAEHVLAA